MEPLEDRVLLTAVANFDFEAEGGFTCCSATPSGWTHVSGGGGFWGVFPTPTFNPAFYPGAGAGGAGTQSGPLAAYFRNTSDIRIGQVLGDTLQPNTTYTLTVAVGDRATVNAGTYFIELLAGGVSLGTATGTAASGTFSDVSVVHVTGAAPAQLGQPLEIRLGNIAGGDHAVDFDNVRLNAVALNSPPTVAANAACVSADEGGTVSNSGTFSDAQGNSTVTLSANAVRTLDLADVVGGGNGTGTGGNQGINEVTGLVVTTRLQAPVPGSNVKNFYNSAAHPFIDGVFVPDGGPGGTTAITVSTTGLTVTGIADSVNDSWDYIWNGNNQGVPTVHPTNTRIGFHANKGITFDLQAIEAANPGFDTTLFTTLAAVESNAGNGSDFAIVVDGSIRQQISLNAGAAQALTTTVNANDRFLTLIATDRGDWGSDHAIFGDPRLSLSTNVGTVTQDNANGTWNWSLNAADGPEGPISVTITANDGVAAPVTTSFDYSVNNLNPDAVDNVLGASEGGTAQTLDLLGNDTDPAGANDPLSITGIDTTGTIGLATLASGQVSYSPNGQFESLGAGETTDDTFAYSISDGDGGTDTATATVTITGQNDAPTAPGSIDDVSVNQNAANSVISLAGLFADVDANDTLTITAVSSSSGLVTAGVLGNSLTLDYQANQSGTATITVTATDGSGASVDLTFDVAVISPAQQGNAIILLIKQWNTDGKINAGVANSMIVKVVNSLKSYDNGNLTAAGNQLGALKNEISAKVKPGGLTEADAALAISLIDALYDSMTA